MSGEASAVDQSPQESPDEGHPPEVSGLPGEDPTFTPRLPGGASPEESRKVVVESPVEVSPLTQTGSDSYQNLSQTGILERLSDVESEIQPVEPPVIPVSFPDPLLIGRVVMNHDSDSLRNLRFYSSSDSESSQDDTDFVVKRDWQVGSNESSDIEFFDCDEGRRNKSTSKGESQCCNPLGEDLSTLPLPDLSKLKIDCDKEEFLLIGDVQSIIGDIVTIHALPNTPAYDLDTILFVERESKKSPLGAIVDVIGPVTSPIYCVRIDSKGEHGLSAGMKVYSAPKSDFTLYVFVKELMKIKGSDASWLNDREMPPEVAEADSSGEEGPEEEPRRLKGKRRRDSPEQHRNFERNMNRWNTLNTRASRLADNIRDYNAACSAPGFIGPRIPNPRSFPPIHPSLAQCPRPFTPCQQAFVPRPHMPFLPSLRPPPGGVRFPGPSRPF